MRNIRVLSVSRKRPTDKVVAVVGEVLAEVLNLHEFKGNLRERLESRV